MLLVGAPEWASFEYHDDHFAQSTLDEVWLPLVAQRGWIAISRDERIFYNDLKKEAVMRSGAKLFILVGPKATHTELAKGFRAALPKVRNFVIHRRGALIARVYRHPKPRIVLWMSERQWRNRKR